MALFCVVEINCGSDDQEIFECPLSWFSKQRGTVCYPTGAKFNSWKGRNDKPPFSKGANWITVPATLKGEFKDYRSAVGCAKRLEVMDTSEEETFRTNSRSINALNKDRMGFSVEGMLADRNIVNNDQLSPPELMSLTPLDPQMLLGSNQNQDEQLPCTSQQYVMIDVLENENEYTVVSDSVDEVQPQDITAEVLAAQIAATVTKTFVNECEKIHVRLDKITEAIANLGISPTKLPKGPKDEDQNPLQLLPIADEAEIEKLDNFLRNTENQKVFVEEMSRFAGKSGAMRGQKVALNIIDKWFKREFLVQCSWTGSMKTKIQPNTIQVLSEPVISDENQEEKKIKKINFSTYKRVIEAFYNVIHLADGRYSIQEAEDFLKKQLRNANNRLKQLKSNEDKKEDPLQKNAE